jgi:hypothetical protein
MPTWDGFLVTVLEVLKSGETLRAREVQDRVADHVGLTVEQRAECSIPVSLGFAIGSGGRSHR